MTQGQNIDGVLLQWGDRLFYPGNRIVHTRPQPKLSGLGAHQRAAAIRARIEATCLDAATLTRLTGDLWSVNLSERRKFSGLPPERADIILTGCAIYEALLRNLRLSALQPSTRGLRFAALLDD